jgi:hypothetical protein
METAKVDIKKLQILSDRINQCIDALNQVRISVHGLSQGNPFTQGGAALGAPGFGQVPGLSHTSPFGAGIANPMALGQNPYANPYATLGVPQGFPGIGQPAFGALGQFGLSHTSPEGIDAFPGSTWSDPYLAARVTQTFPYLKFAVPPIVSLY